MIPDKNLNRLVLLSSIIYFITSLSTAYLYYKSESSRYLSEQLVSSGINTNIADSISKGNLLPTIYVLCDIVKFCSFTLLMIISSKMFGFFSKEKIQTLTPVIRICLISVSFLCLKNISILSFVFSGTIEGYTPAELNVFSLASFFLLKSSGKGISNLIGIDTIISILFYGYCIGSDLEGRNIFRILGSVLFISITVASVAFCMGGLS